MSGKNWDRVPIDAQSVDAPLSAAAVFLVVDGGERTGGARESRFRPRRPR